MKILDFLHQTKTQAFLAYLVVIGFPLLIWVGHLSEGINNRLLDIVLLSATFYFGSSKSGADKDKVIADNINNPQVPVTGNNPQINVTNTDASK